ncbi:hypothetical protein KUTeg_006770 [Tegillarca granosa]|uniref:Uncharacterized protein n=1 Tax=Tegillarca granosa TaxID=220873 RepID=A0ABQ9FEB8_TEGGR|nr:hypothetical protein KUTeg_006770 [Tegillarca granosa]
MYFEITVTTAELQKLAQRYNDMDELDDIEGVSYEQMMTMPEFIGSPLAPKIVRYYANADTNRIHGKEFLLICTMLSDKTDPKEKKEFLFDLFNNYDTEFITHEEIFEYYKLMFDGAISDDHILALAYRALRMPNLKVQGRVEKHEFVAVTIQ